MKMQLKLEELSHWAADYSEYNGETDLGSPIMKY